MIDMNIKHFRKRCGLTQEQLAEKLSVTRQTLARGAVNGCSDGRVIGLAVTAAYAAAALLGAVLIFRENMRKI